MLSKSQVKLFDKAWHFAFTYIILLPLLAVFYPLIYISNQADEQKRKAFQKRYQQFLADNEGREFFCYTNRKNSAHIIEQMILPKLEDRVSIIKLDGKVPCSEFDAEFVSHALYHIKNIGFPNVMKVVDGQLIDVSLHNDIYHAINCQKYPKLNEIVKNGFCRVRA